MKRTVVLIAALSVTLVACETPMEMQATGGSRADGTVNLSFEYGLFQKPVVDTNAALQTARSRCQAWNYADAQPFGGQVDHCNQYNGYGMCMDMLVTVQYQCMGANAATNSLASIAPTVMVQPATGTPSVTALGVAGSTVTSASTLAVVMNDPHGVFVSKITPGSVADRAGLKPGDVVQSFNGLRVSNFDDLNDFISKAVTGSKVTLGVWRDRKSVSLSVPL